MATYTIKIEGAGLLVERDTDGATVGRVLDLLLGTTVTPVQPAPTAKPAAKRRQRQLTLPTLPDVRVGRGARVAILGALKGRKRPMKLARVASPARPDLSVQSIHKAAQVLCAEGVITRVRRGWYLLAEGKEV